MLKSHWRFVFLRWHRRIGVAVALFLLLLAVTGILLNHSHDIGLDHKPLENRWLRAHYGLESAGTASAGKHELAGRALRVRDGQLWLGEDQLTDCAHLVGVMESREQVLVVCPDRLVLLTPDGQLIDQADSLRGIPSGLSAVSSDGDTILLKTADSSLGVNLADLSVHQVQTGPDVVWQEPVMAMPSAPVDAITWERVMLDLHSGRLFGSFGVWLVDLTGIATIVLALSGVWLFFRRRRVAPSHTH